MRITEHQEGIEPICPDQINQAYEHVVNKDVCYRFVIDMAYCSLETASANSC